jgi:antitoxin VapB
MDRYVGMAERRPRRRRVKRSPSGFEQPESKALGLEESGRPIVGAAAAQAERRVRLFKNGRSQAVRIPREFELPGKEAIMRKEGERLIIESVKPKSLLEVLATLEPLDEEFPPIDDQLPEPVDL